MSDHIVAVDIGTGSARAGLFDLAGTLLAKAECPIFMNRPRENHAEHDSEDIWAAATQAVRNVMKISGVDRGSVAAIGFDATCSLVVRDRSGEQISVSTGGKKRFDTIVWLDHRAVEQADFCTKTAHPVLEFSGNVLSPEMQMPKLMWLKNNLPEIWDAAGYFFDLADFMTWKATGSTARSRSTLVSKWNYLAHKEHGWQEDFLAEIGLEDLREKGKLPEGAVPPGAAIGHLGPEAAQAFGLTARCTVGAGLIDAYAGVLGLLGRYARTPDELERHLALIAGTSTCAVAFSRSRRSSHALWGPYYGAVFPNLWLVEAGQSAAGALLDHVVRMHAAGGEPTPALHGRIVARIAQLRARDGDGFGARIFVLPDFHGNRSPLADPHAVGVISGLTLDTSFDSLCTLYWRTGVSIALGIRHILDAMTERGYRFETLHLAGGHIKNPMLIELYADVTGRSIIIPKMGEAVLLGTAMAASVACGKFETLFGAASSMSPETFVQQPDPARRAAYDRDYRRFLAMYRHRAELDAMV